MATTMMQNLNVRQSGVQSFRSASKSSARKPRMVVTQASKEPSEIAKKAAASFAAATLLCSAPAFAADGGLQQALQVNVGAVEDAKNKISDAVSGAKDAAPDVGNPLDAAKQAADKAGSKAPDAGGAVKQAEKFAQDKRNVSFGGSKPQQLNVGNPGDLISSAKDAGKQASQKVGNPLDAAKQAADKAGSKLPDGGGAVKQAEKFAQDNRNVSFGASKPQQLNVGNPLDAAKQAADKAASKAPDAGGAVKQAEKFAQDKRNVSFGAGKPQQLNVGIVGEANKKIGRAAPSGPGDKVGNKEGNSPIKAPEKFAQNKRNVSFSSTKPQVNVGIVGEANKKIGRAAPSGPGDKVDNKEGNSPIKAPEKFAQNKRNVSFSAGKPQVNVGIVGEANKKIGRAAPSGPGDKVGNKEGNSPIKAPEKFAQNKRNVSFSSGKPQVNVGIVGEANKKIGRAAPSGPGDKVGNKEGNSPIKAPEKFAQNKRNVGFGASTAPQVNVGIVGDANQKIGRGAPSGPGDKLQTENKEGNSPVKAPEKFAQNKRNVSDSLERPLVAVGNIDAAKDNLGSGINDAKDKVGSAVNDAQSFADSAGNIADDGDGPKTKQAQSNKFNQKQQRNLSSNIEEDDVDFVLTA